jgi:hypothetical protein
MPYGLAVCLYSENHTHFHPAASVFYRFLSFLFFLVENNSECVLINLLSYIPSALQVIFFLVILGRNSEATLRMS